MKKETWKTVIQLIVSILTAALTALGTTSCMGHGPIVIWKYRTIKRICRHLNLMPAGFLLVFLFTWYHSTNSTLWIRNIALVSWYQVHVAMKYGLTCIFADIDADIITIRMETFIHLLLDILQHDIHSLSFMVSKIEVWSNMTFRNDESMTWRYWITIVKSNASSRFADDFNPTRQSRRTRRGRTSWLIFLAIQNLWKKRSR